MPRAAQRLLDILETFAQVRRPLNVSEVARAVRIPVSTCHGLIKTLETRGYVVELKASAGYYPTKRLERLGNEINKYDIMPNWLPPRLAQLRDQSRETVLVAQRIGLEAVYTEMLESNQSLRFIVKIGDKRPLHATAVGQALLGALPAPERSALIRKLTLKRRTATTITTRAALEKTIEKGLARGWFGTEGDYFSEIGSIAKVIDTGGSAYAIAIAGPLPRIRAARQKHAAALLELHAETLRISGISD